MEKKKTYMTAITLAVLMVALVGATYAYFRAQGGGTTSNDVSVTSNTTDLLTFQIGNDISFTASEANFYQGGSNVSGNTTATATLVPNNKTNQATMNYYMYLNLTSNPTVYSTGNTNEDAELVLQVFDGSNQLVTLTGLGNQVALGNGYGYDITGVSGLITLLDNHAITANDSTTTENWSVVITLVNLNLDQNDNTNKTITGTIIMTKESVEPDFCEEHPNDLMCYTVENYDLTTTATGTTNLLYFHDENLEDGAEDGSYRYSGSNPNNYVCFGSNAQSCPAANLYRIIGFMPVDAVIDSTTTPVTTERQMLYKIIKNDYATSAELGLTSPEYARKLDPVYDPFYGPSGNFPSGDIEGFCVQDNCDSNFDNTWGLSTLNNTGLNTNFISNFDNVWQEKIANVMWKVGGNDYQALYTIHDIHLIYELEIINSGIPYYDTGYGVPDCCDPSDGKRELPNKIGLLYASDYGYALPQSLWDGTVYESNYNNFYSAPYLWLYRGVDEFTITRTYTINDYMYINYYDGLIIGNSSNAKGIRPTFYLTENTLIDRTQHTGTQADPYRIS